MRVPITFALLAVTLLCGAPTHAETVSERVQRTGLVRCSIDQTPGFSAVDGNGRAFGFDVDFCRAIAAAVLGSAEAIELSRVSTANKFKALAAGELDVALGMTTWTMTRDTALGVHFPALFYYDGQGFMAWRDSGIARLDQAAGRRLCVQSGTTSLANVTGHLAQRGLALTLVESSSSDEKFRRFMAHDCELVTGDRAELAARRSTMVGGRESLQVLGEVISREPLGPVVADGDPLWQDIVRWVVLATLVAEHKGITAAAARAATPAAAAANPDREIKRLLGGDPDAGKGLGLDGQWAQRVLAAVGNYGEIFERNLGPGTDIGLERGQNALWTAGGLMYAPPF